MLGGAKRAVVGALNPLGIRDKGVAMGGSLGKAGRTSLPVTLEGRVALGGILSPTTILQPLPQVPLVAPKPITFSKVKGVKLQVAHITKFCEICKASYLQYLNNATGNQE